MDFAASANDHINTINVDGLNLAGLTGPSGNRMHVGHAQLLLLLVLGQVAPSILQPASCRWCSLCGTWRIAKEPPSFYHTQIVIPYASAVSVGGRAQ